MALKELYIIAGPNGSGKTTFRSEFVKEFPLHFIDVNEIAKEINPINLENAKITAGKEFFKKFDECKDKNNSFIIETTLSDKSLIKRIEDLKKLDYKIIVCFIIVENSQVAIYRIKCRVMNGGNNLTNEEIIRRFNRSINNFWDIYRSIADEWYLLYNSDDYFEDFAIGKNSSYEITESCIFEKFAKLIGSIY